MAIKEDKLIEALVNSGHALLIAERALNLAQEAMIKVETMKAEAAKVQYSNSYTGLFGNDVKSEAEPPKPEVKEEVKGEPVKKLSPFNIDLGKAQERAAVNNSTDMNEEEIMKQEIWDMSMDEQ